MGDLVKDVPAWIEDQAEVRSVLEKGKRPDDCPRGGFRGYFAQASEIAPLHEALGFETLVVAGVEPAISADDESYNKLQEKRERFALGTSLARKYKRFGSEGCKTGHFDVMERI